MSMVYISATEAAKRLGVSEKTIRRWIDEKRLAAFHPHGYKNRLAIAEQDVEQLAKERAEFETPGHKQGPAKEDVSSLAKEVERQRRDIVDLQVTVAALEQLYYKMQGQTPVTAIEASLEPLQTHIEATKRIRTPKAARPPVEGAIEYWQFAKSHGVNRVTFRDQITKGSKRSGEQVEAMRVNDKLWLTPDQQQAAIEYWKRHNVPFTLPGEQDQDGEASPM